MVETTYLLGAGINRGVRGPNGLLPPLARDFFRQALRHPRISAEHTNRMLTPLFKYIDKYWHLTRDDLKGRDFDLEDCFTLLELQRREAEISRDHKTLALLLKLELILTQLMLDFISEYEHWYFKSADIQAFGSRLLNERAAVITFNYDILLESAISAASPLKQDAAKFFTDQNGGTICEDEAAYSLREWDPSIAYKVRFDEIELRTRTDRIMVEGEWYYEQARNQAEVPSFLKMHGSLNWFYRSGYHAGGSRLEGEAASRAGRSVLRHSNHRFGLGLAQIDCADAEILLPLIITPVLNKPYDQHPVFRCVWGQARTELRNSRRLVIGGYSFPPTDFHVRRLLREEFSDTNLDDLCIINPDTAIVKIAKDLCNYKKPVLVCKDLGEFLDRGV